jgi:hypothetical protein
MDTVLARCLVCGMLDWEKGLRWADGKKLDGQHLLRERG